MKKKHSCRVRKQISNKFHQEVLNIIMFSGVFAHMGLKLVKVGPTFSSFNLCPHEKSSITKLGRYSDYF